MVAGTAAAPGTFGTHPVRVAPGSRLASLLGPPDADGELWLDVPTAHHQAIGRLGAGLVATAWAADGTIEAAEAADGVTNFSSPCSGTPSRARIRGCSALSSRRPGTGCQARRSQYPPSL